MQNLIYGGAGLSLQACLPPELIHPPLCINFAWMKKDHLGTDLIVKICGILPQFVFLDESSAQ